MIARKLRARFLLPLAGEGGPVTPGRMRVAEIFRMRAEVALKNAVAARALIRPRFARPPSPMSGRRERELSKISR